MSEATRVRAMPGVLLFIVMVTGIISSLGAPLIPSISEDLSVSLSSAQWSLTATLLVGVSPDTPLVRSHLRAGGTAAWARDGQLWVGEADTADGVAQRDRVEQGHRRAPPEGGVGRGPRVGHRRPGRWAGRCPRHRRKRLATQWRSVVA